MKITILNTTLIKKSTHPLKFWPIVINIHDWNGSSDCRAFWAIVVYGPHNNTMKVIWLRVVLIVHFRHQCYATYKVEKKDKLLLNNDTLCKFWLMLVHKISELNLHSKAELRLSLKSHNERADGCTAPCVCLFPP